MSKVAIVIPSLNPTAQLPLFIRHLRELCDSPIVVVDDGSRQDCKCIFSEVAKVENVTLLRHAVNQGKGRALKTAFNWYLNTLQWDTSTGSTGGVLTADADGQHLPEDIVKCLREFEAHPDSLVLGVRDFSEKNVPWKSKFGNKLTICGMKLLSGISIHDTQTGLRGIPISLMESLLRINSGERFEFETVMLLQSKLDGSTCPIREVKIATVYVNDNRETHFRPIVDSWRIYRVLLASFLHSFVLFVVSSVLSAVLDQAVFALLFYRLFSGDKTGNMTLLTSVVLARGISLVFNYCINRSIVFANHGKLFSRKAFGSYLILCVIVVILSYFLLKLAILVWPEINVLMAKIVIDTLLFISNYFVQRHWCFSSNA